MQEQIIVQTRLAGSDCIRILSIREVSCVVQSV
jgi:hypothetical protein